MTKTYNKLLLGLLVVVLLTTAFVAVAVTKTASADNALFVYGSIELDRAAYQGEDYQVKARIWTSTDKAEWTYLALGEATMNAQVKYYQGDTLLGAKPTAVGTYTVKILVGEGGTGTFQNMAGNALSAGSTVASLSYRVVEKGVNVLFAPSSDIAYDGANHCEAVKNGTKVYVDGEDKTAEYTVKVQDENMADTAEVIDTGVYHVIVQKAAETYTSTFYVKRNLADWLSLSADTLSLYEGMYTTYNKGVSPDALEAERAAMLAARAAYYTPKFAGAAAKANGQIADAYADKLTVTYWKDGLLLAEAPVKAGTYVCRVTASQPIAAADLAVGDFVDLTYTIKPTPYVVKWNQNIDQATGTMYIVRGTEVKVRPVEFALRADESQKLELRVVDSSATYYRANGTAMSNEEVGDGLTALGKYTVTYSLDLSVGEGGKITGKGFFGEADQNFVINASNNEITQEFEIIGTYEITGVRQVYYNDQTNAAKAYIAAHAGARATSALSPAVRYNSSAADNLTFAYTYEGSATFPDGDPVNLTTIKAKQLRGRYECEVTFGDWIGTNNLGQSVQVAEAGDKAHFAFAIETVPMGTMAVDADDKTAALAAVADAVSEKFGVTAGDVTVVYYTLENDIYKVIAENDICAEVGKYAAYITMGAGAYKGQSFVLNIEKKSTATTDSIRFDIAGLSLDAADYTGTAFAAEPDFGEFDASGLAYSVYYQKQAGDVWTICAYPVNPGRYRVVLRFNEPCVYYSVGYGKEVYREFTIRTLQLTAKAAFVGDSVFDATEKETDVTFYVGGRPLPAADAAAFHYTKYYAKASDSTVFTTNKPLDADRYAVGLVFGEDYPAYGYAATALTPAEILTTYLSYDGYMLACDGALVLPALRLDAVVTLPVGYKATYAGDYILPRYAFYKGNEGKSDLATLLENIQGQTALAAYADSFDTYFEHTSSRTEFGSNIKKENTEPMETGRYDRLITVRAAYRGNIAFGRVVVVYDGARAGETYTADAAVVEGSDNLKLNVVYTVNPLPVTINALDEAIFEKAGDTYASYYGEAKMRAIDDLTFETVDETGAATPLITPDFKQYVSMTYYNRLSSNDSLSGEATAGEGGLFGKGSYTLRIRFREPQTPEEVLIYSRYSLVGGTNTAAEGILRSSCRLDVKFDVKQAEAMRVVFKPEFDSYTYDGTAKTFDVRFVSGEDDVTAEFAANVDYRVTYGDALGSSAVGTQDSDTAYDVKVTFLRTNYHFYVEQYVGTYSDAGEDIRYIRAGSTVTYDFVVTHVRYLSWAFNDGAESTDFYYNGQPIGATVDFVSATAYNEHAPTVTLVKGTDYDVWYYAKENDVYKKLREAPTMAGRYMAEIVFLRDLTDYRYQSVELVVYGYRTADANFVPGSVVGTPGYYYGRSLANSGMVLNTEGRYLEYSIVKPTLKITGLGVTGTVEGGKKGKTFDNAKTVAVTAPLRITPLDNATVADDKVAGLRTLLGKTFVGEYESVAVGADKAVYYRLQAGENVFVTAPHAALVAAAGTTGVEYFLAALDAVDRAGLAAETLANIDEAKAVLEELQKYYDLVFEDVKADIAKGTVTVLAKSYSRTYDPEWDDTGVLSFSLSAADKAKLKALLPAAEEDADFFVGSLTRENADSSAINESGYLIKAGDDFGFVPTAITLSDDTACTLNDIYTIKVSRALYYINPCPIVVGIAGNRVTAVYGEEDPMLEYTVVAGTLREGDELVYVGTREEQRRHDKAIDDVGAYPVSFAKVRVYRFGLDVSANYRMTYRAAEFVITPLEVTLRPVYEKENGKPYYVSDEFVPTNVGVSKRVGNNIVGFDDLASRYHASIQSTFGRVEVANADPSVYKRYQVTLGTIKVTEEGGADVTKNYTFALSENTEPFVVKKYIVYLAVEGTAPVKSYGDQDPQVQLTDYRHSLDDLGFAVAEGSKLSREEGEDVGVYKYLPTNAAGTIRILNEEGEDVTEYCVITVYEGTRQLSDFALTISPLTVVVTVRSETINRTGRSILPEVIFLTEEGTAVSSAITAKMSVRFVVPSNWEPKEGPNSITPIAIGNLDAETNFEYRCVPGTVNVVYPNNVVAVSALAQEDSIANANRYAFVGGVLYRTVQIYATNTLDGGAPDHTVTISLPVTENLFGEDVYIIAVRRDGSYAVREAKVEGSEIIIADDQFYYVLAAQPEYWPYYVIAGIAALIIVAVVVAVLRARKRTKVRGKKERAKKEKPEKKAKGNAKAANAQGESGEGQATMAAVAPKSDEYAVPEEENDELGLEEGEIAAEEGEEEYLQAVDAPESAETTAEPVAEPRKEEAPEKPQKEEGKGKKEKKEKKEKEKKGKNAQPTGYVPSGMAKPAAKPEEAAPIADEGDTLAIPTASDDDDIVIGGGNGGGAAFGGGAPTSGGDDDEIVISTTSRRFEDDDE